MLTALFITALVLGGLAVLGVLAIPFLILGAVIWLVLLPFKILFHLFFGGLKLVFGFVGLVLGLLALPLVLLAVVIGLVMAILGALASLVAPLIPLALVGLVVWAIYHATLRPRAV